jgi:hypothetical protein
LEPCERGCEWPIAGEVPGRAGVAPPKLAPPSLALLVLPRSGGRRCEVEAEAASRLPCSRLPCSRLPCSRPAAEEEEEEGFSAGVSARTGARLRPVPDKEAAEAGAGGGLPLPASRAICRALRLVRVRVRARVGLRARARGLGG